MAKTKIVVIQMKELIYTAIFAGLGILLIVLLIIIRTNQTKKRPVPQSRFIRPVFILHRLNLEIPH